jgi:hypothetical protein
VLSMRYTRDMEDMIYRYSFRVGKKLVSKGHGRDGEGLLGPLSTRIYIRHRRAGLGIELIFLRNGAGVRIDADIGLFDYP